MTTAVAAVRIAPTATLACRDCHDEGTCKAHEYRECPEGASVHCARCAGTGAFITGSNNGKPTGPGGDCYRCSGKGFHTRADRRRNWAHTRYGIRL